MTNSVTAASGLSKEVTHQSWAVGCEYALGMELHPLDHQLTVSYTHDFALGSARRDQRCAGKLSGCAIKE